MENPQEYLALTDQLLQTSAQGTALAALLQQSRFLQAGPLSLCGSSNNKSLMKADAVHNNL